MISWERNSLGDTQLFKNIRNPLDLDSDIMHINAMHLFGRWRSLGNDKNSIIQKT